MLRAEVSLCNHYVYIHIYLCSRPLDHERMERSAVSESELDVLHVYFYTVLENLLVLWAQARADVLHGILQDLHFIGIAICI